MFTLIRRLFGKMPPPPQDSRIAALLEENADLRRKIAEGEAEMSRVVTELEAAKAAAAETRQPSPASKAKRAPRKPKGTGEGA